MAERNECTASGCRGFCCLGPLFFRNLTHDQVFKYWPGAKPTLSSLAVELFKQKGVYFKKSGESYEVRIIGHCPNLNRQFDCDINDDKPPECINLALGQEDCIATRSKHSLIPYREWNYKQR